MSDPPPEVAAVFAAMPNRVEARMREVRGLILAAAAALDVGDIEETLKWGQPAHLPVTPKVGTTVRLGWSEADPDYLGVYVHCQTRLLDGFRERFPDAFRYVGNRAILLPVKGAYPEAALQQIAGMALTYHRDKRNRA